MCKMIKCAEYSQKRGNDASWQIQTSWLEFRNWFNNNNLVYVNENKKIRWWKTLSPKCVENVPLVKQTTNINRVVSGSPQTK
jgi:hypothetical protein